MDSRQNNRDLEWLKHLIRSEYDPVPNDWPNHKLSDWDDGIKSISEQILNRFKNRV